jgi:hypothetical protein
VTSSPAADTTLAPAPSTTVSHTRTQDLFCGVLSANTVTFGQGSGANTFELRPTNSARTGTLGSVRFGGWASAPALGTYVCVWLEQGAPMGGYLSRALPGEPGYIADILPNLFMLPAGCAYVAPATTDTDALTVRWRFDCGATANSNARGALGPAFTTQGWTMCSSGLANQTWRQSTSRLTVSEGAGGPGGYPFLAQSLIYNGGGGPSSAGC